LRPPARKKQSPEGPPPALILGPSLILGIDPGSFACGYGIIKKRGNEHLYVASGRITIPASSPLPKRLAELYSGLTDVIREFAPQAGAVEKIFFAKGIKAALSLGHARGIALLALANEGLPVYEYSALEVKKAVTGYGRAEKAQVQAMVKRILSLSFDPSPDGADALALALCHLQQIRLE
jgi:crossover junction endodeoxyribonuclease RuvC